METTYLEYLKVFHKNHDTNAPLFRTFIDNWYGYYRGGVFLNRNNKPKWFNNPNPVKQKNALLKMDFVSEAAFKAINGEVELRIIKDHAIPVTILRNNFSNLENPTIQDIRKFLIENYKLGVISIYEDKKLNENKLKAKMPTDWDGINWKARYDFVDLKPYK